MRVLGMVAIVVALMGAIPDPATAGLGRKCRKACKPAIADCMAVTGQSRKACRKTILPLCKQQGLEACISFTVTPTTVPTDDDSTTTTSIPDDDTGGGAMSLDVDDVRRQGDQDPRLFDLDITIGYSVVTANAVTSVALDPSTFTVLDEDTDTVYPAEPAAAPGDCSADDVVTKDGPDVSCTLHFLLPAAVGTSSKLRFASHGLHGSKYWSY